MKRDMDLIRLQLLRVEGHEPVTEIEHYSEEQLIYHMALCIEAGLVDGHITQDRNGYPCGTIAIKLTWAGHEFLDAARNQSVWVKVTKHIKASGVDVTLGILKQLLAKTIKDQLGLSSDGDTGE